MKKICLALLLVVLTMFGFLSVSYSLTYSNSGEYMFTMDGNDSNTPIIDIETAIEGWFSTTKSITRDIDLDFYSKIDAPADSSDFMTVTYGDSNLSGTWSTHYAIEFYTVKGGTQFAFYWVAGGSDAGTWNTEHLINKGGNIPEISHLSSWNPLELPPPAQNHAPEPATMLLFGLGLLGLAGISRRKK
jgi:hypothetical protein